MLVGTPPAARPKPDASIVVDVSRVVGRANRRVFGGNLVAYQKGAYGDTSPASTNEGQGVWDPVRRRPVPQMLQVMQEAGMSVARWPGGCATHAYDWKRTIGPPNRRPDQLFGLPEYLRLCAELHAEPLITVSEYHGTAQDAADLVEYLNSPNDGRHPWAKRRAEDGHPAPWRVRFFEYGNESEHGLHYSWDDAGKHRKFTPREYGVRYLAYRAAMRRVDPRVRLGAVIATGFPDLSAWAQPVARLIGPNLDFAIHHCYIPSYDRNDGTPPPETLFKAALAAGDQIQDYYDRLNHLLRTTTGRSNTPIAVTEYNGAFVQDRPVPYRHSLGNALLISEMLRVFLRPRNHILMANFWEFPNEYWGQVRGFAIRGEPLIRRPQFLPFALYHAHFQPLLLDARVRCGSYETSGGFGVAPAMGKGSRFARGSRVLRPEGTWQLSSAPGATQRVDGRTLAVHFSNAGDLNYYHARLLVAARPNTTYRLTGWVRTEGLTSSSGACFQVGDARGWPATRSAAITPGITGTHGWTRVQVDYQTLPDTRAVEVLARRVGGGGEVAGRAWYRDVELRQITPRTFAAVPYLGVTASRSVNGRTVSLIICNRRQDAAVTSSIHTLRYKPNRATAWTLDGPSIDATNEQTPNAVRVYRVDIGAVANGFAVTLPPHSLTALVVEGTGPRARQ